MPPVRSPRIRSSVVALASLPFLALGVSACGDTSSNTAAPSTTAGAGTMISIRLSEWEILPSADTAKAGPVTFRSENIGVETHEMVLFKTDLAPEEMPLDQDGAVDEAGAGLELIDEVEDVKAGELKQFTATLAPGKYVMACNAVENGQRHFMNKMYKVFTVTA